ncbi:hypothetical protein R1flu_006140 [Riccia fluitans]|uniref:riboflavin kinase n=1 Tax=Riccia fluitans TaxID=41844 RepID=A0ABD1YV65_9MARC
MIVWTKGSGPEVVWTTSAMGQEGHRLDVVQIISGKSELSITASSNFSSVLLSVQRPLIATPSSTFQSSKIHSGFCRWPQGARIIISNPEGKGRLAAYRERSLEVTEQAVQSDLNRNEGDSTLNAPEMWSSRAFPLVPNYPLRVREHIVKGFGRGSKQMGIPTANVDPEEVPEHVLILPKGVYCGWAQVNGETLDKGVHKMVMNIGNRPTFADGGGISVEVHILYDYGDVYFYGEQLSLLVVGFIREEMQFKSIGELVQRILADIETARKGLDEEDMQKFVSDEVFSSR